MWTRIFLWTWIASLAALTLGGAVAFAQDAGSSRAPNPTKATFWGQVDWLGLEIGGGRITLTSKRCGQTRLTIEPTEASPVRQTLTVDSQPGTLLATVASCDERET